MRLLLATLFLCLLVPSYVEARPSHVLADQFDGDRYRGRAVAQAGTSARDVERAMRCGPPLGCRSGAVTRGRHQKRRHQRVPVPRERPGSVEPISVFQGFRAEVGRAAVAVLGGRPAGCPHRFCGCGASIHVFGRIIPSLNLAANWLRFPRTAPAPDMVAARRGHVFVLKRHIAGNTWLVFDANSGGHRTRIHPRSIAGYAIVNPHGGRA